MLKHGRVLNWLPAQPPAAFRRLCVETFTQALKFGNDSQPPSGGCVLKRWHQSVFRGRRIQPPSGGCVLKQTA